MSVLERLDRWWFEPAPAAYRTHWAGRKNNEGLFLDRLDMSVGALEVSVQGRLDDTSGEDPTGDSSPDDSDGGSAEGGEDEDEARPLDVGGGGPPPPDEHPSHYDIGVMVEKVFTPVAQRMQVPKRDLYRVKQIIIAINHRVSF